jgi:hypothetical protein
MIDVTSEWAATRNGLHRVAVHVMARRRSQLVGKIGLRAATGGIATPAAGPEHEVLRTAGSRLVRERTGAAATTVSIDLAGATLAEAAALADVDLAAPLDVGHDTPPVGDPAAPLTIDPQAAEGIAAWFAFGWAVLDETLTTASSPSVIQLWPEHFDAACDVAVRDGRTNLGVSPGDGFHDEPYLYVGPWEPDRPGDASYWNAPFGAVLTHAELRASPDPVHAGIQFLGHGLSLLTA